MSTLTYCSNGIFFKRKNKQKQMKGQWNSRKLFLTSANEKTTTKKKLENASDVPSNSVNTNLNKANHRI